LEFDLIAQTDFASLEPYEQFITSLMAAGALVFFGWLILSIRDRFAAFRLPTTPRGELLIAPLVLVAFLGPQVIAAFAVIANLLPEPGSSSESAIYFTLMVQVTQILLIVFLIAHTFRDGIWGCLPRTPREITSDASRAVVTWLWVIPPVFGLLILVETLLKNNGIEIPVHGLIKKMRAMDQRGQFLIVVSAVVLAPIAEELFYRGILQTYLRRWVSPWAAIFIATPIFIIGHYGLFHAWPSYLVLSVALGYCYERSGRIAAPILVHMLFNAVTMVNLLLFDAPVS
jgi:membrane protease YdiL (CAAX protease family)